MGNELQTLSTDINVITAEINAYQRVAGEAIFEIGKRLKHVKENVIESGKWTEWLQSMGISPRQAQRYLQVTDVFGECEDVGVRGLSISHLLELTHFDKSELYKKHELPTGKTDFLFNLTTRELQQLRKNNRAQAIRRDQPKIKRTLIRSGEDRCYVCGFDCTPILHLHHVTDVKFGGDNAPRNVELLCPNCHAIVHNFLTDKAETEYGLDYLVSWINTKFPSQSIGRIRELWERRFKKEA